MIRPIKGETPVSWIDLAMEASVKSCNHGPRPQSLLMQKPCRYVTTLPLMDHNGVCINCEGICYLIEIMKCKYRRWVDQYLLCYVCAPNQWKFMSNPEIRGNLGLRAYPAALLACLHHPHICISCRYTPYILLHIYSGGALHCNHWTVIRAGGKPVIAGSEDCSRRLTAILVHWLTTDSTDWPTDGRVKRQLQSGAGHHGQLALGPRLPL